jgi:aminopeptidase N
MNYRSKFSNDGYGCMLFVDKTVNPQQYYTYTHFEPHYAHRFIPCFDQPDLKAQLRLNVIVPDSWVAVGN